MQLRGPDLDFYALTRVNSGQPELILKNLKKLKF
jgi:hypothetical protein